MITRLSLPAVAALLLLPAGALAQPSVELDLDGQLGNGPDIKSALVGDFVDVDLWLVGSITAISGLGITLCNLDGALEFQGATYEVPSGWTLWPPDLSLPGCAQLVAVDYGAAPISSLPALFATATYHVVIDETIGELSVDLANSDYVTSGFEVFNFDGYVGATIEIGLTDVDESHWGEIKSLFR